MGLGAMMMSHHSVKFAFWMPLHFLAADTLRRSVMVLPPLTQEWDHITNCAEVPPGGRSALGGWPLMEFFDLRKRRNASS